MTKMKLLSTAEAGKELGFSSRTIARWCRNGDFGLYAVKIGRVWRIQEKGVRPAKVSRGSS